jgi:hypothetical protein
MKELEFHRLMRGLPMPTETHFAVLKSILVGGDLNVDGTQFALAFGAVARVPADRIHKVTMRQLLDEYNMPLIYACAEPMAGDGKQRLP